MKLIKYDDKKYPALNYRERSDKLLGLPQGVGQLSDNTCIHVLFRPLYYNYERRKKLVATLDHRFA